MKVSRSITLAALLTALLFTGTFLAALPTQTKAEDCCTESNRHQNQPRTINFELECATDPECLVYCVRVITDYWYDYPEGCEANQALLWEETWSCNSPHTPEYEPCVCDPWFHWNGGGPHIDWCGPVPL